MEKKQRTVTFLKNQRSIPETVQESRKKYIRIRKAMMEALGNQSLTIPQLAKELSLTLPETTYYLMTLQKFGEVEALGLDDDDAYYLYQSKKR